MKHTQDETVNTMEPEHLLTTLESVNDQLQDLRVKLRTENKSLLIPFRLSVVTHYRNTRSKILGQFEQQGISRHEVMNMVRGEGTREEFNNLINLNY